MLKNIPGYQIILLAGAVIIVCMTLYPPWRVSVQFNNRSMAQPYCWAYLFNPPDPPDAWRKKSTGDEYIDQITEKIIGARYEKISWTSRVCTLGIDFSLLFLEYFIVVLLTGALAAILYIRARKQTSLP